MENIIYNNDGTVNHNYLIKNEQKLKNRYLASKITFEMASKIASQVDRSTNVKQHIRRLYGIVFSYKNLLEVEIPQLKNAQQEPIKKNIDSISSSESENSINDIEFLENESFYLSKISKETIKIPSLDENLTKRYNGYKEKIKKIKRFKQKLSKLEPISKQKIKQQINTVYSDLQKKSLEDKMTILSKLFKISNSIKSRNTPEKKFIKNCMVKMFE